MARFLTLVFVDPDQSPTWSAHNTAEQIIWSHCTTDFSTVADDLQIKCDAFEIGGIFDGCLWDEEDRGKLPDIGRKDKYGMADALPENNIRSLSQLRETVIPASCITPDGKWHDLTHLFPREREEKWSAIRLVFPDCLVVAFECHR